MLLTSDKMSFITGFKTTRVFFLKKPNPVGFIGFWGFIGFFGQAGKNR